METFEEALSCKGCQMVLDIVNEVTVLAPGIGVVRDGQDDVWLLCFDSECWQQRVTNWGGSSYNTVMVTTESFLIGVINDWVCSGDSQLNDEMLQEAMLLLQSIEGNSIKTRGKSSTKPQLSA
jgi:hypothetical protein